MNEERNSLNFDELKDRFKGKNTFSRREIEDFYKEIYSDISKNSINSKIYRLKNDGLIRNVARGQFEIVQKVKIKEDTYIVINIDVIKSSKENYKTFNENFRESVELLNNHLSQRLRLYRKYHISQGDEIQIIYPYSFGIKDVLLLSLGCLRSFYIRFAVSIGEAENLKENSWEMNGPIFWNSRDLMNKIKSIESTGGGFITGFSTTDRIIFKMMNLINDNLAGITEKQWEAIVFSMTEDGIENLEKKIGIKKTSYYERLDASGYEKIRSSFEGIEEVIENRRNIG